MKFIIAIAALATIGRVCAAPQRKRSTENKYTTKTDVHDRYLGLAERKLEKEELMSMDNHGDHDDEDMSSVFSNYMTLKNEGQGFALADGIALFEEPDSDALAGTFLYWISDLTFFENGVKGYAGRMMRVFLTPGFPELVLDVGGRVPTLVEVMNNVSATFHGISSVYIPHLDIFSGTIGTYDDNAIYQFWDDGTKSSPWTAYEVLDHGDPYKQSFSSGWSGVAVMNWVEVDEVAEATGIDSSLLTLETFDTLYEALHTEAKEKLVDAQNEYDESIVSEYSAGHAIVPTLCWVTGVTFFLKKIIL